MSNPATIRALNDAFRTNLSGGRILLTPGVQQQPDLDQLLELVRRYSAFTEGNDPYGEHDFGAFDHEGDKYFWKIDYYDQDLTAGSEDPADPIATTRVLTLMLASEY